MTGYALHPEAFIDVDDIRGYIAEELTSPSVVHLNWILPAKASRLTAGLLIMSRQIMSRQSTAA